MQITATMLLTMLSGAPSAPINPRPVATGVSTIEQRHTYMPPDEGQFEMNLVTGLAQRQEVSIEEPSMCHGSATVKYTYSKSRNRVTIDADFHGLPYRMSYTRPTDISTQFNQWPQTIENGVWQFWIVPIVYSKYINMYYDGVTLAFLGSQFDFPNGPPPTAFPVSFPVGQMIASPLFEGRPNGKGRVHFEFAYNGLRDEQGKAGVYFSYVPKNLCTPDEYVSYYTNGGLPDSELMTWDDAVKNIATGSTFMTIMSLEPNPKPNYLLSRDSIFVGWGQTYPQEVPQGYSFDGIGGTLVATPTCATHTKPALPAAIYDVCSPQ